MIHTTLSAVADSLNGRLIGGDQAFTGVSIDTRTLSTGSLFIALSGENFEGHSFCSSAIESGAVAIVVEKEQDIAIPQLIVENCRNALRDLSVFWRNQFDIPMVAITGSSGKTTVKEMVSSIFSRTAQTLSTHGNLNNELGVPLTLLRLSEGDQFAVIEIGANHVGEIERIVDYVRPTIAVITMVGPSHLEGFGSIEAIAGAKSEIYSGLQDRGIAVVNRDDHFYDAMASSTDKKRISFGMSEGADVSARLNNGDFVLLTPSVEAPVELSLLGVHNRHNALAAAAVATAANVKIEDIVNGLQALSAVPGRLQVRTEISSYRLIDDTYNANPASVMAAIDVLDEMSGANCLVVGDMAELGADAAELHRSIGEYAAKSSKQLFCVGLFSKNIAEGFGSSAVVCEDMDALFTAFIDKVERGSNVLVKGSRSAGMERIIKRIIEIETDLVSEESLSV